ncbi:hypothetical protein [Clostridium sp. DJ247]|uniref:hypothetical protein n=1 Tax=Clostridium sp. DJ247 TaxID=2726188 RepID=UPI0016250480|nr:hypothetical protein [Clostridium sp. DJ247]MBC2582375.1 hypothetical protein [Clostridium sp. DJ247]
MSTHAKKIVILSMILTGSVSINYLYNYDRNNSIAYKNDTIQTKEISINKSKQSTINNVSEVTEKPKTVSEENNSKETLNNNSEKKQLSRGSDINNELDITLTFYSGLADENGGFKGINCSGKKLTPGMVANNVLPQGTKIYTKEYGTLTVADKGGSNFDTVNRLDVYVSRNSGESDEIYRKRVTNMGRVKVRGYIVK